MGESLRIEIPNTRQALPPATAQAEAWLEEHEASPRTTYFALLAIEELVINCIDYGYDGDATHIIAIELSIGAETLSLTAIDDGRAFNPLEAAAPDLGPNPADRSIGGLGLHMLRSLADSMAYERRDGTNRLTLTRRLA